MTGFTPIDLALLALAAAGAGIINTIVGSGSLITFPTLLLLGVPPVPANMANTVELAIGNVGGVLGYRRELRGQWRSLLPLIVLTIIGALLGALALLWLPASVFRVVAPVLIVIGCVLVAIQPLMNRGGERRMPRAAWTRFPLIFGTGAYGGYFGAARGVLIVGVLRLTTADNLQRVNAAKNVLQTIAGVVATVVFIVVAPLPWTAIITIVIGVIAVIAVIALVR